MKLGHFPFETRKWEVNRREVNEVYKKNKAYTVDSKKQMFAILENLLSSDDEKQFIENVSNHLENIASQEENYASFEQETEDNQVIGDIRTLEEVRNAALSVQEPSVQDLRIAIEASNQINQIKQQTNGSVEEKPEFKMELLNRLRNQFYVKNEELTFQNHDDVKALKFNKKYQNAISKYQSQMKMAQYNFQMEGPIFTLTA